MSLQMIPTSVVIISFFISQTSECLQKNISCNDIKTPKGFRFLHLCPEGSEINVYDNKTKIAHASSSTGFTKEVISMNNTSVVTRDCRDLNIECIVPNGVGLVKENCLDYKITETEKNPDPDESSQSLIIGVSVAVPVAVVVLFGVLCYIFWKMKWNCTALQKATDSDSALNQLDSVSSESSAIEQHGGGENDEHDGTFGSVHNQSGVPKAEGETAQSYSQDHNSNNVGIQPNKNEDMNVPGVNSSRDDPVDDKGEDIVRIGETHNGWTRGGRGPEDRDNEGQALLSNPRAASRGSDMTVDAVALVDERGFDPDRVTSALLHQEHRREVNTHHEELNK